MEERSELPTSAKRLVFGSSRNDPGASVGKPFSRCTRAGTSDPISIGRNASETRSHLCQIALFDQGSALGKKDPFNPLGYARALDMDLGLLRLSDP